MNNKYKDYCKNGHKMSEHAITRANGKRRCMTCARQQSTDRYANNKRIGGYANDSILKNVYGLTQSEYIHLKDMACNQCGVCGVSEEDHQRIFRKSLAIDHNSRTGAVRGLLCSVHNMALGAFDHDPAILQAAIEYLELTDGPI